MKLVLNSCLGSVAKGCFGGWRLNAVLLADAKIVPDSASTQRGGWALPVASIINLTLPAEHPRLES